MTDIITHHKTFSGKWTGAMGSDHLPSIGEFQRLLHESSVFLFYGTERCLGSLPPNMLCPMNLTECNVAFIMDLVQTNSSFLRQSRDDSAKTVSEISLEDPLECAMLFSLAGVGCVLTNTWHGQLQDNKNKLIKYFTVLLEDSKPIGQALRSLIEFPKPSEVEQDAECSSEKGSKHGNGARKDSKAPVQNPLRETELHMPSNQPLAPAPRQWFNTVLYGAPTFLFNPAKTL
ncbi:uncharacterized protein LOC116291829 [Actinia tenebrosa]|uniref:Uncharacterized protein LOC116291829 n=1 Tax=Actinia tenebrosa TaxID=6105 RepID=A0A6P8HEQ3_ACTTE|nr:uncharacterized protein LOC116291829 [Actinia tenebrosa]